MERQTPTILNVLANSVSLLVSCRFIYALFLVLVSWSPIVSAVTSVNIYISSPRGGFGDTAANLLMIERLSQYAHKSDLALTVVFPEDAKEQIQTLWPDFSPDKESQNVRGLVFKKEANADTADIALTFSSNGHLPENLGTTRIVYYEYEETRMELGDTGFREIVTDYMLKTPMHALTAKTVKINTGVGKGIYALDGFRNEDFNKDTTFKFLRSFAPAVTFADSAHLGYAYASSLPLAQQYIKAVETWSTKYNQEIVVVTNHEVQVTSPMVKIIRMTNLPFSLNQKIIKSSTIPILVTGDGSLSLAFEARKPFFYSMYAWKRFTADALRETFKKRSHFFKKNKSALDYISNMFNLDISGNRNYENDFLNLMENAGLQSEISKTLDTLVKNDSLITHVGKDIKFLQSIENGDISIQFLRGPLLLLMQRHRDVDSPQQFFDTIENGLFNRKIDPQTRVRQFFGMIAIKDYPKNRFAEQFSKALLSGDYDLRSKMSGSVVDLHSRLKIPSFFHLLTPTAQKEVILLLKNLAAQDPVQWGSFVYGGKNALEEIQTFSCRRFYGK